MALEEGAVLVQVSRALFMRFIAAKPRTLQIYLHKVLLLPPPAITPSSFQTTSPNSITQSRNAAAGINVGLFVSSSR